MRSSPKWSMASDIRIFAVIVMPANAPAPTLSTNSNPVITAKDPINPPSGAHHGIALTPSAVGNGRGRQTKTTTSRATTGRKETTLANHGLVRAERSAPFIGGPQACKAPAPRISGYSQTESINHLQ